MRAAPRITVIDDDPALVAVLVEFLGEMQGYDVRAHTRWQDAHESIRRAQPDLVILDVHLDGRLSGLTILEQLVLDPDTRGIPVLVCSAVHPLDVQASVGLTRSTVRALRKPFDLDELLRVVETMLAARLTGQTNAPSYAGSR